MSGRDELEEFIGELISRAGAAGYVPTAFISMRDRWGTVEAINRLMRSGQIQSGFRRLRDLGLLQWSIEAAVIRFPERFGRSVRAAAQFRLDHSDLAD
jgi:hypothetical protein